MWKSTAESLAFGQRKRIECCVPRDLSAIVSNDIKGMSYYCFRCHASEFIPHKGLSNADIIRMRALESEVKNNDAIPKGTSIYSEDVPADVHVWLGRAGISLDFANALDFTWNSNIGRVVMPVLQYGGDTGSWLARSIKRSPKYLSSRIKKPYIHAPVHGDVVVVEDMLSAIRVGQAGYTAVSLMGTSPSLPMFNGVRFSGTTYLWLDPDDAGIVAAKKTRKVLGMKPTTIKTVHSDLDPKLYSKEEIQNIIEETRCR